MMTSRLGRAALVTAIALAFGAPVYAQSDTSSGAGSSPAAQSGSNSMQGAAKHGTASAVPDSTAKGATAGAAKWDADTFDRLDKNGDGRLSQSEAQADPLTSQHWARMDSAKSGSIDRSGFEEYGRTLNPNSATPKEHPFSDTPKK